MIEEQKKYAELTSRFHSTRRKESLFLFFAGLFKTLAFVGALILTVSLIELVARGDTAFRTILLGMIVSGFLVLGGIFIFPVLMRVLGLKNVPGDLDIALRIGNVFPDIKDKLSNVIQIFSNIGKPSGTSKELALAAFNEVSKVAGQKDFDAIIDKNDIKRSIITFFFTLFIVFAAFGIFQSSLGFSFYRILNWNKSFLPPAPFTLTIEPKTASAIRGTHVIIYVKATGTAPEKVSLYIREEQQENYDVLVLHPDSIGIYKYEIPSIRHSLSFFAEAPWLSTTVRTEDGYIKVVDKPLVRSLTGRIVFPSYTKLGSRNFDEQSADISALKGSQVNLQILSNKSLSNAYVIFEVPKVIKTAERDSITNILDSQKIALNVDDKKAYGSFKITKSCSYYVSIKDNNGEINSEPIKYNILALNDEYPAISLITPTSDVQLTEDALLPIKVAISDDYGFSVLKLFYRLSKSAYTKPSEKFTSVNIPILSNETASEVPYLWNLNNVNISPEDSYEFYVEVYDNDIVSGPKSAKTQILTARLPSLDEVLSNADNDQKKVEKDLKDVISQTEDIKKDVENLNKEMMKNQNQKDLDWKEKKKAQDIMKKNQDIQEKLSNIKQKLDNMTQSLQENKALSPETLEKYQELQKLMQEVNSPELKDIQKKMQQALEQMTPEQMQQAMQQVQFNEEAFKKSIERTLKILKRLKAEQKVDALTKRAEELEQKQEELQKKMENTNPDNTAKRDELANQQKKLKEDLKNMTDDLKDLEKLMKEIGEDMPMDDLKEAKDELNEKETSKDMQDAQEASKSGDFNKAQKSQKSAAGKLKNFAAGMKKLKKKMEDKVTQEAIRKMQKAISDMLELSQKQKGLKSKTNNSDYNSMQLPNYAKEQENLEEALMNVANSLAALSEKSFAVTSEMGKQIGDALRQMQNAINKLTELNSGEAAQNQG
ncbi:MAG: hypothetical protein ABSG15_08680, partial [FCB group bacterium]